LAEKAYDNDKGPLQKSELKGGEEGTQHSSVRNQTETKHKANREKRKKKNSDEVKFRNIRKNEGARREASKGSELHQKENPEQKKPIIWAHPLLLLKAPD